MNRVRLCCAAGGGFVGVFLCALGWGTANFYLVAAGAVVLASCLAWLTIPMPVIP